MYLGILTPGDLDIAWRTVRQEAAGEPYAGKVAVAWTFRNRLTLRAGDRWATLAQVCLDWLQYSGWRDQDPNLKPSQSADLDALGRDCLRAVLEAFGSNSDPTNGARHYYAPKVLPDGPKWARGLAPSAVIGGHRFFNNVA